MKDILIIAQYTQAPGEFENDRFKYLAEFMLEDKDISIEVVTMDFSHHRKKYRHITTEEMDRWPYKMTFLHVTQYKKNVSIKRLFSNGVLAINLKKYFKHRKKPDVVFCALPSIYSAYVASKYCKRNGIKFVIDIQDLWPEAFQMSVNIRGISKILFAPMKLMVDQVYASADVICAVSQTYIDRALEVNKKARKTYCVFLGTDLDEFDKNATVRNNELGSELRIAYCGTIGRSYDLKCVIDALQLTKGKTTSPISFLVMGDGPDLDRIKEYALEKEVRTIFWGRIPYKEMCGILAGCDIVVNPIIPGASQSIINKHADYAASGLPVVNTQECEEYRNLVQEYQMGFNCNNNDAADLSEKILLLANDSVMRKKMGENARRCAEECFDRKKTYQQLRKAILDFN
ncbi:hypothetical protein B5F53_07890 [Blautia sp. An249]|uniref:glycosyltransferase family 4 protein n=1 Tax=Blautia sp. An249 TaxID=1965603 RepID=UPI000B38AF76|nr:glycosyltransferase family 4 protein [Blautia sp. An249]OUO79396.1 hypothetical protein B5F53_07890 [Blautia sp. An249]